MCEEETEVILAVGAYDATVACFGFKPSSPEKEGLRRRFRCRGHSGSVRAVATHGQWLATGSTDETIRLYDLRNCSEIGSLVHHEGSITWLGFSGDQMFSASEDGTIAVWRTGSWTCISSLTGHKGPVSCVAVHPSGRLALSVGRDRILRTWDLSSGVAVFRQKLKEVAQQVKWSDCARYYALSCRTNIQLYSVQSGDVVSTIFTGHTITSFIFVSDEVGAVASEQPSVQLFSLTSGDCVAKLRGHSQRVKGLAKLPEKDFLFSASSDGSVRVWKLAHPLTDSVCVSVCEVGCRLNCIALASPDPPPTAETTVPQTSESKGTECGCASAEATGGVEGREGEEVTAEDDESESKIFRRRPRVRRRRGCTRRMLGLFPFRNKRAISGRRHRHQSRGK